MAICMVTDSLGLVGAKSSLFFSKKNTLVFLNPTSYEISKF